MLHVIVPAVLATTLAAVLSTPVAAQRRAMPTREQMGQLNMLLDSASTMAGVPGRGTYSRLGPLPDDSSESWTPNVTGGVRATIVGVCLEGCTDLNIRVLGADGSSIAQDVRPGTFPVVQFTVPEQAGWRALVVMAQCGASPCWYGARIHTARP